MNLEIIQGDILDKYCDLLVVNLFEGVARPGGATGVVDKALSGEISKYISRKKFEGKLGEWLVIPSNGKIKAQSVAVMGLGKRENFDVDSVRKLGGFMIKLAKSEKVSTLSTILHGVGIGRLDAREGAQALTEGLFLGSYHFKAYKGAQHKKKKQELEIKSVTVMELDSRLCKAGQEGLNRGKLMAEATSLARDLVNTPSSDMTPARLAAEAQKLAVRGSGITCKIFDHKAMERIGMRAALAVGRGSLHAPVGVHLIYRPAVSKKTVAVVGKAVSFDSGGLSLKPSEHMTTMKIDMAGAASVIGLFKALSELKPKITVHGIFLAVENMPSGSAYRPGDVVAAMDGTTIEVLNTDAEGRVTLADALCYAKKQKPDMIIDLATLTGACVVALGEEIAGLMTDQESISEKLLTASKESGEPLWRLPLFASYQKQVESKIADIKNVGGGSGGGTITAALFLKTFVGDTPWAHIDIAGPSYTEKETRPDQAYGASGYGVRLISQFLASLVK
ncbi:MAG: leucyl aminopeptidase [Patescibacteria group bacterium]